jgi:hypothetical protein
VQTISAGVETAHSETSASLAIPVYLTPSQLSQYVAPASSIGNTTSSQTFGRWLTVDLAVSEAAANQATLTVVDTHAGVDTVMLSKATTGYLGSTSIIGGNSLSLAAGSGTDLKGFDGLGKGLKKIK